MISTRTPWHIRFMCRLLLLGICLDLAAPLPAQSKDFTIFPRYNALTSTLDEVDRLVSSRKFEEARARLKPCLAKVPDHFEAFYYLALMAYETKDYDQALAYVERSKASLAELDRLYQTEMGALNASQDRREELLEGALQHKDRGMGANNCSEGDVLALKLAISLEKHKRGPMLGTVTPFSTPKEYHFLHGNCLFRLGRYPEARSQYEAALRADPRYGHAWNNLINLLRLEGKLDQARACLQEAEAAHVAVSPELAKAVKVAP